MNKNNEKIKQIIYLNYIKKGKGRTKKYNLNEQKGEGDGNEEGTKNCLLLNTILYKVKV